MLTFLADPCILVQHRDGSIAAIHRHAADESEIIVHHRRPRKTHRITVTVRLSQKIILKPVSNIFGREFFEIQHRHDHHDRKKQYQKHFQKLFRQMVRHGVFVRILLDRHILIAHIFSFGDFLFLFRLVILITSSAAFHDRLSLLFLFLFFVCLSSDHALSILS